MILPTVNDTAYGVRKKNLQRRRDSFAFQEIPSLRRRDLIKANHLLYITQI